MPISIDDVFVFSAGGIVGYLARTLLDHLLARNRATEDRSIKAFNDAAIKFRAAFSEEITRIKTRNRGTTPNVTEILGISFPKHLAAVDEFRNHLLAKDLPEFNEVWDNYDNGRRSGQYTDNLKNPHDVNPQEPQLVALDRLEKLMKFAAPK